MRPPRALTLVAASLALTLVTGCKNNWKNGDGDSQGSGMACEVGIDAATPAMAMGVNATDLGSKSIAQSFEVADPIAISKLELKLFAKLPANQAFSSADKLTVKIFNDAGDGTAPKDADPELAKSEVSAIEITDKLKELGGLTLPVFFEFKLDREVAFISGRSYWIALEATYAASATKLIMWAASSGSQYPSGGAFYKALSAWKPAATTRDLNFRFGCK